MILNQNKKNDLFEWIKNSVGDITITSLSSFVGARMEELYEKHKEKNRAREQDVRIWTGFKRCYYERGD